MLWRTLQKQQPPADILQRQRRPPPASCPAPCPCLAGSPARELLVPLALQRTRGAQPAPSTDFWHHSTAIPATLETLVVFPVLALSSSLHYMLLLKAPCFARPCSHSRAGCGPGCGYFPKAPFPRQQAPASRDTRTCP